MKLLISVSKDRNRSAIRKVCLGVLVATGVGMFAASVRADSLANEVANNVGPVYATYDWQLASGSVASGDFVIQGDPLQTPPPLPLKFNPPFQYNNIPYVPTISTNTIAGVQNVTEITDPTPNNDPGVIGISIGGSSTPYLVEEVDMGYNTTHIQNMQVLFESTTLLGFGPDGVNKYWFAFLEGPGTSFAPAGTIIGGVISTDADIKSYVVTPLPNSFASGFSLLALMGTYAGFRKFTNRLGASRMQA
jgi:hypothetical protein